MDGSDEPPSPPPFPPRMFALGDEPVGVTPYHKPTCIRKILNALEPDEAQTIRETQFGKLVEIADKPSFSGRFGRFLLSRQLKVAKKHEVRFLFAGKPIPVTDNREAEEIREGDGTDNTGGEDMERHPR
ncbi:hypothetical protein IGI04_037555 [Brassica rapa subsp. trilocularis]|uniref:Uncharacterized protein n=1 Tax=Brassica rapa subsp. trilocularis TaxID=1813537 RepID=A0ABQ7LHQ4_BRACM|nr:hypothetical protein IGI04_037555 [Brassica rapa subsp. trilocularis]